LLPLLVGCVADSSRGRVFSPPGPGNQTFLTYDAIATGGGGMNCALVNVAAAMCWGRGTLGDGRTTQSDFPIRVTGGIPLQTR